MTTIWTTVRTHWKKTIFFNCVSYYVSDYLYNRHQNFLMMREYCLDATAQGSKPLPFGAKNKHITLLLNPVAAKRKAKDQYENFGEPILHCAGFLINSVQTERISEARDLTELIEKTNIIAVAGGDGTLLETITGLLRREDADEAVRRYPIALIPAGKHNNFAKHLYPNYVNGEMLTAEGAMSIVRHSMRPQHVIRFQIIKKKNNDKGNEAKVETETALENPKPVFAMTGLNIGQYREAAEIKKTIPSFLGEYLTTFISLLRTPKQVFKAEIRYTPACYGCKRCYIQEQIKSESKSLWSRFYSVFRTKPVYAQEIPKTENPECGVWTSLCVDTSEFNVSAMPDGYLKLDVGAPLTFTEFVQEGLRRCNGKSANIRESFKCNEIEIKPIETPEFCSIDSEEFEMQEIKITILRNKVYFFTQT